MRACRLRQLSHSPPLKTAVVANYGRSLARGNQPLQPENAATLLAKVNATSIQDVAAKLA
jgi:hypothetical protein